MKRTWNVSSRIKVRSTTDSKWGKSMGDGMSSPVMPGTPPCRTYSDVTLWQNSIPDDYPVFYLTDSDGEIIRNSTSKYLIHHVCRGLTNRLDHKNFEAARVEQFKGEHTWGGWMSPEHGHLLIDHFAGYFHAVDQSTSMRPVYVRSPNYLEGHVSYLKKNKIAEPSDLIVDAAAPGYLGPLAHFEKITVSQPSFIERTLVYDWHLADFRKGTAKPNGEMMWLSRKGDAYRGVYGNHDELESLMESLGFLLVQPETLPLSEQVDLFSRADVIAGFIGSAFHTLLLCPEHHRKLIYLSGIRGICSANFPMIDRLLGNSGFYYDIKDDSDQEIARQIEAYLGE